jgi:hypothetical protein
MSCSYGTVALEVSLLWKYLALEDSRVFFFAVDVAVEQILVFKSATNVAVEEFMSSKSAMNVAVEEFMSFSFLWMKQ